MAVQRAILALLLAGDLVARTIPELTHEIGDRDAIERAVAALEDYGLLEIQGGESQSLLPTRTARHVYRLEAW